MKCAYCDFEGKMSREHIIPKGFIEHMNFKQPTVWFDKAPTRVINAELTVKDVCPCCNNGELSKLDSYALNLILKYNEQLSIVTKKIYFKYNYNLLIRWLMKICYNSARANDAKYDINQYEKNVDFIMDRGKTESNISVFAMYIGTGCLNKELAEFCHHLKGIENDAIDWFRIGPFKLVESASYYCASRCIIINSFAFFILVCEEDKNHEMSNLKNGIKQRYENAVELTTNGKVWLKRDDKFFFESWVSNAQLRDNFMKKRMKKNDNRYKLLTIYKKEIEAMDFTKLNDIRTKFMSNKDDLMDSYQSVIIAIDGYENEVREPYQHKSFQNYFRQVFDDFPEIIWVLLLDEEIITVKMMIWAYVNDNSTDDVNNDITEIKVNNEKSVKLLQKCFMAINKLTNIYAFDFSKNEDLTRKFKNVYFKSLDILETE